MLRIVIYGCTQNGTAVIFILPFAMPHRSIF